MKEVIVTVPPGVSAKIPMTTMISTGIKTFTKFGVTQAKKISKYYKNLAKFINENKPKNCILIMYLGMSSNFTTVDMRISVRHYFSYDGRTHH